MTLLFVTIGTVVFELAILCALVQIARGVRDDRI